jgi:cytosine deaminase
MGFDLVIRNARTRFSGKELLDIGIKEGRISRIRKKLRGESVDVIDASGMLVTESFVDSHLHLCKVYTLSMIGDRALVSYHRRAMGRAMTAIELASKVKEKYDEAWIIKNVRKALRLAVKYGTTHLRAFADTDTKARLEGVKALLRAKEEFKEALDIQVVAFPQDGVVRDPGAEEYIRKALELGADVVGGIPWIEYTDEDAQEHIDRMFKLARGSRPSHPRDACRENDQGGLAGKGHGPPCPGRSPVSGALFSKDRGAPQESADRHNLGSPDRAASRQGQGSLR